MSGTPKDFILRRIKKCILDKLPDCRILYDVVHRRIGYNASGVSTVYTDITEPLMALYQYFADIEDEHWREKLVEKFAVPMDMLYPKDIKQEGKYKFIMDKKPKVYISGPITGLSEKVYKNNFNSTELYLTGLGYDVVNPVSYPTNPEWKWEDYDSYAGDCDYGWDNHWTGNRKTWKQLKWYKKFGMDDEGFVFTVPFFIAYLLVFPGTLYHIYELNKEMKYYEEYHRTHYFNEESMTWEEKKNG